MSAPRPYETDPFRPPALFVPCTSINFYIYTKSFQLLLPCGIYIVSWEHCTFVIYACALPEPVISRFSAILKSFCPLYGAYWYEIQPNTAIKTRHKCIAMWRWRSQLANFTS